MRSPKKKMEVKPLGNNDDHSPGRSNLSLDYKVHLSSEKNQFIFVRENYPRLMIYATIMDGHYELVNLNFLDHCDASVLGKVMMEFHHYIKGEISHPLYLDTDHK